jgi:hypothetical protein
MQSDRTRRCDVISPENLLAESGEEAASAPADPRWVQACLDSDDLKTDSLPLPGQPAPLTVVYLATMVNRERLVSEVYEPLQRCVPERDGHNGLESLLPPSKRTTDGHMILKQILDGHVALFAPESEEAILLPIPADKHRSIAEATTEVQLIGPKAAFTEHLDTNLNQLRTRLPTPRLRIREQRVGRLSNTRVVVAYLDGISNPDLGPSLCEAISRVDIDFVRGSNDLEVILVSRSLTPFPLAQRTERPDRVASALADGRAAIFVDGTPFPVLVPSTLNDLMADGEAFLGGSLTRTFVRLIRIIGLTLAVLTPALYTAFLMVNPRIVPPQILLTVAATREGIPYSVLFEALLMILVLDLVTEATLSAPSPIGQTLTIAGSLIVGQAAVQARLASQLMVIVLALTSLGSMLTLNVPLSYAIRISRYLFTVLGSIIGTLGITLGVITLLVHLASLKSWGVPYLGPFGPARLRDLRLYGAISAPKSKQTHRPETYHPADQNRAPAGGKRPS